MKRIRCLLGRDLALNWNDLGAALRPVMFFALVAVSFPLGLGADPTLLRAVAPGLVWVSALLAVLLALDGLFREDAMDGTLEQWLLSDLPLSITVLARLLAQWISHVAPVVLMGPVLGAALGLPLSSCGVLFVTLLIGTPTVLLIGALAVHCWRRLVRIGVVGLVGVAFVCSNIGFRSRDHHGACRRRRSDRPACLVGRVFVLH